MKLEILTPVHIGSGDKYLAMDFVIKGNKVVFIDSMKFFEEIEKRGLNPIEIAKEIGKGEKSIEDYVENLLSIKMKEVPFNGRTPRKEILMHIKSHGKPYIPGSSIKGAIRTAILWKEIKDNKNLLNWIFNHIENELRKKQYLQRKDLTRLDDKLEEKIFRKANLVEKKDDPKNDLLRAVIISDSTFLDSYSIYQVNFLGMRNFSVLVECVDPEQIAEVKTNIDKFILYYLNQKLDYDCILSATREFAEKIVEIEINRNYPEKTKHEFKNVLKSKGIILRVGWGTGWYSTTIGTLLKTHPKFEGLRKKLGLGRNPRTRRFSRDFPLIRRITSDRRPLGWISIHE